MTVLLDKCLVLKTACVARQAERSVAFGLRSEAEWTRMRKYCDRDRLQPVLETIDCLCGLAPGSQQPVARASVIRYGVFGMFEYAAMFLLNCFRNRWRFSVREIHFITAVLRTFLAHVQGADQPEFEHLVELRMNLLTCGLTEVLDAHRFFKFTHACQPPADNGVTLSAVLHDRRSLRNAALGCSLTVALH